MLVASTSLGVSSVFGATIGGVLLAVEITSTYYLVAQYFKVRNTPLCIYSILPYCVEL
jgi:H+/Cl- antiporter ClcA